MAEQIGSVYVKITSDMSDFNNDMQKVKSTSEQVGKSGERSLRKIGDGAKNAEDKASSLERTLGRLNRTLLAFAGVVVIRGIFNELEKAVSTGIKFNQTIENTNLGIASLLISHGKVVDSYGRQLKGLEQIHAAQYLSLDIQEKIKMANLETAATYEQITRAFQETLAPALKAGFNTDQILDFTTAMVQAASAIGLNLDMLAEETRSLLQATITPRTTRVATALGITNEDIRAMMGDGAKLFSFLMGKLEAFRLAGEEYQKTLSGIWSNLKDAITISLGQVFEEEFSLLKTELSDLFKYIVDIDNKTKTMTINPEVLSRLEFLKQIVLDVYDIVKSIGSFIWSDIIPGTKEWYNQMKRITDLKQASEDVLDPLKKNMGSY